MSKVGSSPSNTDSAAKPNADLTLDRRLKDFADAFAPLVVVLLLCDTFGVSSLVRLSVTGGVFLLIVSFMWFIRSNPRFAGFFHKPKIFAIAMSAMIVIFVVSIVLLLRAPVTRPDPWVSWESALDSESRTCEGDDGCLKRVLKEAAEREPAARASMQDALLADLRAGQAVSQIPAFAAFLKEIGIDDRFLGTGLSLPQSAQSYDRARLPEYLVPNYPQTYSGFLLWRLSTLDEGISLQDLIENRHPMWSGASRTDLPKVLQDVKAHLQLDSPTPALIRFAEIPESGYSGCLGPRGRRKVFASHLGMALKLNLSVEAAADLSGSRLHEDPSNKIYVFVFLPSHPSDVTAPTWTNILSGKATTEVALCPPLSINRHYSPL